MKSIYTALFVLVLTLQSLPTCADIITSPNDRMQVFYTNPTKTSFDQIQASLPALTIKPNSKKVQRINTMLAAVFLARVHETYGFQINTEQRIEQLAAAIITRNQNNEVAKFVIDESSINYEKVLVWWVSFYASGELGYVRAILSAIHPSDPDCEFPDFLSQVFLEHCKTHQKIRTYAKNMLRKPSPYATVLRKCSGKEHGS